MIPVLYVMLLVLKRLWRGIGYALRQPETRGLVYLVGIIIAAGTVFYHLVEGWDWVDAFYFTIVTLATVGYGDFAPQTPIGKLFTTVYILMGLGVLAAFIAVLANYQRTLSRSHRQDEQAAEDETQSSNFGDPLN